MSGLCLEQLYLHRAGCLRRCAYLCVTMLVIWLGFERLRLLSSSSPCRTSPLDSDVLAASSHAAQHCSFLLESTLFQLCRQVHSIVKQRFQCKNTPAQSMRKLLMCPFGIQRALDQGKKQIMSLSEMSQPFIHRRSSWC